MNYETADDSFITTVDDIFSHTSREKKISEDGEITPVLIRVAVEEVFVEPRSQGLFSSRPQECRRGGGGAALLELDLTLICMLITEQLRHSIINTRIISYGLGYPGP